MGKKILVCLLLGIGIMISSAIGSIIGMALAIKIVVQPMISQFSQGLPLQQLMQQSQQLDQQGNSPNQTSGNSPAGGQQMRGPGGCTSLNACITYCTSHPTDSECQRYSNMLPKK